MVLLQVYQIPGSYSHSQSYYFEKSSQCADLHLLTFAQPLIDYTMFSSTTQLRVRYGETDRMGYVYYGNYAEYFEVGRVEALRALGWNYRDMEDSGILLPVYSFSIRYFKPAFYDDLLTVKTMIRQRPGARIQFHYEIYNEQQEKLNEGETTLVFINAATKRPCGAPEGFSNAISPYFDSE